MAIVSLIYFIHIIIIVLLLLFFTVEFIFIISISSGSIASSKQCPCCRKPVPSLRILPLFPNGYEESILEDPNSQGAVQCDHSNFNITISNLRKQLTESQTKLKEAEDIAAVQS